jgi:Leucine-rich repeat (LRR) protein
LIILDVSRNKLTSLPVRLGECSMLEQLLGQENRIVSLPEEIGRCSKLRLVDLKNNCLETTPVELVCRVDSLVYLDLEGNPCNAVVRGIL